MNILILEDNERCRKALHNIVLSCTGVKNVYSYARRDEALLCAMDNCIDLFLLDIILESDKISYNSGIAFAENIRKYDDYRMTPIIFITALMGLERELLKNIHCYGYIEKPIGDGKLVKANIEEVLEDISLGKKPASREYIPLHYDGIGYMVFLDEVIYFTSRRGVLYIYMVDDEISIPNLSAKKFFNMIHRTKFLMPIYGTYINVDYISNVDFRNREVYLKYNHVVPIGGRKFKKFKEEYLSWKE